MKRLIEMALMLCLAACLSTDQVARNRNMEFWEYNHYSRAKFWQSIDIARLNQNLAQVQVAIVAENYTPEDMMTQSYLRAVRDSLESQIEARNKNFQIVRSSYFDTTATARKRIFESLKSDSTDLIWLSEMNNSHYFDLYQELLQNSRNAILASDFYHSQSNFETYLKARSFTAVDQSIIIKIFRGQKVTRESLNDTQLASLKNFGIDFLILYSISFASDYSEQAGSRIGSEYTHLTCFSVSGKKIISEVELICFRGNSIVQTND